MIRPFRGTHPQIHPTAFIEESAQIVGDVIIGEQSSVWFNAVVRGDVFYIRIGDRTNIQDGTVIHVTNGTHATVLEDEVTVGHHVTLHGCHIEKGCLIGMGATIMDGARIGAIAGRSGRSCLTGNASPAAFARDGHAREGKASADRRGDCPPQCKLAKLR